MREGISNVRSSETSSRIVWSGAILVTVGLSALLLAGEWFAAFDACVANPTCVPPDSVSTLEGYLEMMVAGVGVTVIGATIVVIGIRSGPTGLTPFKTPLS
jgi:hypothetical protein